MFRGCEFEATTETVVNQVRVEVPKWVGEVTTAEVLAGWVGVPAEGLLDYGT